MVINNPDKLLPAMIGGANKAITLTVTLCALYSVWMGVYKLLEKSKATDKCANLLYRPTKLLFKKASGQTVNLISLNLAANMLGLGGVATPLGIEACSRLQEQNAFDDACLLVIISATSIQLFPTTVLSLASSHSSANPSLIILPTLLCTTLSTLLGILLFKGYLKIKQLFKIKK